MTPQRARLEEVFVVRVWREADDSAGHWRGRAEHVRSTKVRYFSNLGALCEFIASHELLATKSWQSDPDGDLDDHSHTLNVKDQG